MTRAGSLGYRGLARGARGRRLRDPPSAPRAPASSSRSKYVACHEPYDDPYDVLLDDHEPGQADGRRRVDLRPPEGRARPARGRTRRAASTTLASTATSRRSVSASSRSRCCEAGGWTTSAWRLDDTVHPFDGHRRERRHPADDALRRRQPRRDPLLPARVRSRRLRASGRRALRPHAARRRCVVGVPRVPEPAVGEPRRARASRRGRYFYPRLQEAFPERLGRASRSTKFHRALNRVAPGRDPRGRRRGHLLAPRHPALRARAGAARGRADARRPAGGLRREAPRVPRRRAARTSSKASYKTSTGRTPTSATSRPTRSAT